MELRHLRYFITVAEELHFSRAAQRLGMSQPPLSKQIRVLERELGVELFRRDPNGVTLTDAGQILWSEANRLVGDADQLVGLAESLRSGQEGLIRIGAVGTTVMGEVPSIIRRARTAMPRVTFTLHDIETGDQALAFLKHRIDVGVIRPPFPLDGYDYLPLVQESLVAAVPIDHPLAGRSSVNASELRDEDFILFPRRLGQGLFDVVTGSCLEQGFRPRIRIETERMQTIVCLIASGAGVSIVPECVRTFAVPGIAYVDLAECTMTSELGLVTYPDPPPQVRRFLALARNLMSQPS
ncbi:LysR substrate-binding domain-containing protein [Ornithinimicrobium cavernae]|uniref:LysR substrate-binding domain-containing protein n=1 Tax=Ornithinimicrobium cavernae TaxID=2666047 RepID=UPI000D69AB11|nr:LysR substrate-binding domain-containing protein [Ornithinimicrobium cavernae]